MSGLDDLDCVLKEIECHESSGTSYDGSEEHSPGRQRRRRQRSFQSTLSSDPFSPISDFRPDDDDDDDQFRPNSSLNEIGSPLENKHHRCSRRENSNNDSIHKFHFCQECSKRFPSPGKLKQHIYIHTGETPFECHEEECEKKFTSRFKLKRHILIHSTNKSFHCSICNRAFRRKDHLKNHEKVHSSRKTLYTCESEGCSRSYNSVSSYRKHQAMHAAEEGALDCKICHQELISQEALMLHLKVHYGSRSVKGSEDKKFPCDQCEKRFFTRKDLKRHSVVHTGDREFPCPYCSHRFGRKDHMVRHAKKTHPHEYGHPTNTTSSSSTSNSCTTGGNTAASTESRRRKFNGIIKKELSEESSSLVFDSSSLGPSEPLATLVPTSGPAASIIHDFEIFSQIIVKNEIIVKDESIIGETEGSLMNHGENAEEEEEKKNSNYSPSTTPSLFSPIPSPGLAHILDVNDSSGEKDLDIFISELVSGSDFLTKGASSGDETSNHIAIHSSSTSSSSNSSSSNDQSKLSPSPSSTSERFPRIRNASSDSVTQTKNPVLPSVYADNTLIVPDPAKIKYPSSFQLDSEDSLSDLRALLPEQDFSQGVFQPWT